VGPRLSQEVLVVTRDGAGSPESDTGEPLRPDAEGVCDVEDVPGDRPRQLAVALAPVGPAKEVVVVLGEPQH